MCFAKYSFYVCQNDDYANEHIQFHPVFTQELEYMISVQMILKEALWALTSQ